VYLYNTTEENQVTQNVVAVVLNYTVFQENYLSRWQHCLKQKKGLNAHMVASYAVNVQG